MLHPHRPLLIPGTRQAKGLVPSGQLNSAGAGFFGQCHGQHFDQDPIDVVLGLLLGQTQRVDLNPIAEAAMFWVFDTIALLADFIPKLDKGAHFAHLGYKADACIHKERNPRDHRAEILGRDTRFQRVENRLRRGQGKGQFLFGRGTGLLQMVGTDIHRVPFWHVAIAIFRNVGDHLK